MDLDVVIVHFHSDRDLLRRCLDSVAAAADRSGATVRVIFVNNGGTLPVHLLPDGMLALPIATSGNIGFGSAVNLGVTAATAPSVLVLNPDAALDAGALAAFDAALSQSPDALFVGWMFRDGRVERDSYIDWDFSSERLLKRALWTDAPRDSGLRPVEKVSGGALFARTDVLRRFGPFDERFFMYCEDADLSRRARRDGHPLFAVPAARVEHSGSASEASFHPLVEAARADGAIRVTALHRNRLVSLLQRAELASVTMLGLLRPRVDPDARRARRARFASLRRWRCRADAPRMDPSATA
jgi:N-acetylglucosaminyl-diphospho-decaprenol L-rhamnosyltransferase